MERYGNRIPNARELRVIELVAARTQEPRGRIKAIGITEHVVKNYLLVIYDKLGLWNRVELDRGVLRTFFSGLHIQ